MTLPAIDVGIWPLRSLGMLGGRDALPFVRWIPDDYFAYPLTFASFEVGASDYDIIADEIYCPCGVTLPWDDRNLGTAVELAEEHITEAHPEATKRARAKRRRDRAR